jgi:hypothetical protein
MRFLEFLCGPKAIGLVGLLGLADAFIHMLLPIIFDGYASSLNHAYNVANKTMFFASLVALLAGIKLSILDKRLQSVEQRQGNEPTQP